MFSRNCIDPEIYQMIIKCRTVILLRCIMYRPILNSLSFEIFTSQVKHIVYEVMAIYQIVHPLRATTKILDN